jgi:hypothetical protein
VGFDAGGVDCTTGGGVAATGVTLVTGGADATVVAGFATVLLCAGFARWCTTTR